MTTKEHLIEYSWLPEWAYSEDELIDIKNQCVYFSDEVYALYVSITESYFYRADPDVILGFDSIKLI